MLFLFLLCNTRNLGIFLIEIHFQKRTVGNPFESQSKIYTANAKLLFIFFFNICTNKTQFARICSKPCLYLYYLMNNHSLPHVRKIIIPLKIASLSTVAVANASEDRNFETALEQTFHQFFRCCKTGSAPGTLFQLLSAVKCCYQYITKGVVLKKYC